MEIQEAITKILQDNPTIQTQSALAEFIGISTPMVNTYRKGKSRPNLYNAAKIWGKFEIQVEPFTEDALQKEWAAQMKVGYDKAK